MWARLRHNASICRTDLLRDHRPVVERLDALGEARLRDLVERDEMVFQLKQARNIVSLMLPEANLWNWMHIQPADTVTANLKRSPNRLPLIVKS